MTANGDRLRRILYVETNEDDTVGGSHKALFDLVTHLDRGRFEPVVLFYRRNSFSQLLADAGVETGHLEEVRAAERAAFMTRGKVGKSFAVLGAIRARAGSIRAHRADLIHVINSPRVASDDWLPAAKLVGVPCVASEMLMATLSAPGPIRRRLIRRFDRILPVSGQQERLMRDLGVNERRITRIYHGIDSQGLRAKASRPPQELRRELGVVDGQVLVAMVANIREWKGQHVLLEALAELPEGSRKRVHAVFAGSTTEADRPYRVRLEDLVRSHGLEDQVSFLGFRSDAPDLLHGADVAVHASVEPEPGGVVVLEAMALGTAVIASDTGGQAEVITPECGIVFEAGNARELARHLLALVEEPERRRRLGNAARERMQGFSIARNADETQRVYEELLGPTA